MRCNSKHLSNSVSFVSSGQPWKAAPAIDREQMTFNNCKLQFKSKNIELEASIEFFSSVAGFWKDE